MKMIHIEGSNENSAVTISMFVFGLVVVLVLTVIIIRNSIVQRHQVNADMGHSLADRQNYGTTTNQSFSRSRLTNSKFDDIF